MVIIHLIHFAQYILVMNYLSNVKTKIVNMNLSYSTIASIVKLHVVLRCLYINKGKIINVFHNAKIMNLYKLNPLINANCVNSIIIQYIKL